MMTIGIDFIIYGVGYEEREKYFKKCWFYACRTNHCNSDYGGACGNRWSDGNSVYTESAGVECDGRVTYDCVSG